ncbi:MAG: zinc ribbon domain-containing protein [Lachnospiraceae bacterium]
MGKQYTGEQCGYTELYKRQGSNGWDIFDFLTN